MLYSHMDTREAEAFLSYLDSHRLTRDMAHGHNHALTARQPPNRVHTASRSAVQSHLAANGLLNRTAVCCDTVA